MTSGSQRKVSREGFERWLSDIPRLLRDPLEIWLSPKLERLARQSGRTVQEEVAARTRVQLPESTSARPLGDSVTSLKILRNTPRDVAAPPRVRELAESLVGGRNDIAHLNELSTDQVLAVLSDSVDLLRAIGADQVAEQLARRHAMLERQTKSFPFPEGDGRCGRRTLFIAPCSAHKVKFPEHPSRTPGPHDVVTELRKAGSHKTADALVAGRAQMAERADLNVSESGLLPAFKRYSEGTFWKVGATPRQSLMHAVGEGINLCLISGAYGIVHACEPIGYYDIELADANWKPGVIENAIAEYASALACDRVVALLRVPTYQKVVRRAPWRAPVRWADILSPEGVAGPASSDAALGEALERLIIDGMLPPAWVSAEGAMLSREGVRG